MRRARGVESRLVAPVGDLAQLAARFAGFPQPQ
jgi:hypothetical protein